MRFLSVLAELGVGVSLICNNQSFLPFLEAELKETLRKYMTKTRILLVEEQVQSVEVEEGEDGKVIVTLDQATGSQATAGVVNQPVRKLRA